MPRGKAIRPDNYRGNKNAAKPPGDSARFSLSYSREDTAQLKRAWQLATGSDPEPMDFKEWLKAISKSAPLEYAYRVIGLYEEDEDADDSGSIQNEPIE
jgi:hypothetical protein